MAIRMMQQQQSSKAVLSALMSGGGVSRRQAYRYLLQAQSQPAPRPVPEVKGVFTVKLPRRLIQTVRVRCRQQRRPISQVVAEVLRQWVEAPSSHG